MGLTNKNLLEIAFKKLVGRAHTNSGFEFYNEGYPSSIQLDSGTIFANTIPTTPGGSYVTAITLTLEAIESSQYNANEIPDADGLKSGSAPTGFGYHAYILKTQEIHGVFPSGTVLADTGGKLQLVPPKYGSDYIAKLYDAGSSEIPPFDAMDWILDYYNGILFVQDPISGTTPVPTTITAYLYTGVFVSDVAGSTGPTGVTGPEGPTGPASGPTGATGPTGPGGAAEGPASGDLAGMYPSPTVVGLRGRTVSATAPTNNQVLTWNSGAASWNPATPAILGVTGTTPISSSIVSGSVTLTHATSGVIASTYGSASVVPVISVDNKGHATGITNTNIAIGVSAVSGIDPLLNARVPTSRTVSTTSPYLTGGGALTGNLNIAANVGTTTGTLAAGDDSRFTNSRGPTGPAGGVLYGSYPNPDGLAPPTSNTIPIKAVTGQPEVIIKVNQGTGISGQTLKIAGSQGANPSVGGSIELIGGDGLGTSAGKGATGGSVSITSGGASTKGSTGVGGSVNIIASSDGGTTDPGASSGSISITTASGTRYAKTPGDSYNSRSGSSGPISLSTGNGVTGSGSSGAISLVAGSAGGAVADLYPAGSAGTLTFRSGNGGDGAATSASSPGGDIAVIAGRGGAGAANSKGPSGGSFSIMAGEGGPGLGNPNYLLLGTTAGNGGSVSISAGPSGHIASYVSAFQALPGSGGNVTISSGAGNTGVAGNSGRIEVSVPPASNKGGDTGSILLSVGQAFSSYLADNATKIFGDAGSIILSAGAGANEVNRVTLLDDFIPARSGGSIGLVAGTGGSAAGADVGGNGGNVVIAAGSGGPGTNTGSPPGTGGNLILGSGSVGTSYYLGSSVGRSGYVHIYSENVAANTNQTVGAVAISSSKGYWSAGGFYNNNPQTRQVGNAVYLYSSYGGSATTDGSAGSGGPVRIRAGSGGSSSVNFSTAAGGQVYINSGDGGNGSGGVYTINGSDGGIISIRTGSGGTRSGASANSGAGGNIEILTGAHGGVSSSVKKSGTILIGTGYGSGTNTGGGDINIYTGTGDSVGGSINILSGANGAGVGAPTPTTGGSVVINAGVGLTTNGSVNIGTSNTFNTNIGFNSLVKIKGNSYPYISIGSTHNSITNFSLRHNENGLIKSGWIITDDPNATSTYYPLEVYATYNISIANYGALRAVSGTPAVYVGSINAVNASLRANGRIICDEFDAVSDQRNKIMISKTNDTKDRIKQVTIRDYKLKSYPTAGVFKGVFAQELEEIFPEFVSRNPGVVGDIYNYATEIRTDGDYIEFKVDSPIMLKSGDRVKVISESSKEMILTIESEIDGKVRIKKPHDDLGDSFFVYGREVTDCRTVNYDGLFSAALEVLQELIRDVSDIKERLDTT
jgi:hypothetical protein